MPVSFAERGRIDQLLAFLRANYSPGHILARDRAMLEWQFDGCPSGICDRDHLSILEARSAEGELLGIQGVIGGNFVRWGEPVRGAWLCNLMVAEAGRTRGAGLALLNAVTRLGRPLVATMGIAPQLFAMYPRLGYHTLPAIPRWVGIIDRSVIAERFGLDFDEVEAGADLSREPSPASFGDEWDVAWERERKNSFSLDRTSAYMNWRYRDHPRFDYRMISLSTDGGTSVAVFRHEQAQDDDLRVLRVLELHGSAAGCFALVSRLGEVARESGCAFMDYYDSAAPAHLAEALRRAGWRMEGDRRLPTRFQPLETAGRAINLAMRWGHGVDGDLADFGDFRALRSDNDLDRPN